MKKIHIILAAIVCLSFKTDPASLAEVRQVFDRLNTLPASASECAYMYYTVTSVAASKEAGEKPVVSRADFEMYASVKQNRVYSKDMILLKDQSNTFAIMPSRKMIYISDAVRGRNDANLYSKLRTLQDTIFKNAEEVNSRQVDGQAYNKVITLALNKKMAGYLGIKTISYSINSTQKTLQRVFVEYQPGQPFISLDYVFNKTELNSKKTDMSIPVKRLVYDSDKKLAAIYSDFKVIDNRKK